MGIGDIWDQLVNCIVRPPRDSDYTIDDLIGGRSAKFSLPGYKGYTATREDLQLVNKRGFKLQCSHYIPDKVQGRDGRLPCVIYCHCNSGSRRDCEEALYQLLPLGISVFSLDFAGSGLSDGDWVSLGAHEVDDVEVAVRHLRATGQVSTLGLWGRSMGAVTALLYSQRDPSIAGMVLDSPFSSLTELMMEIVEEQQLPVPKALMKVALAAMKRSVRKRAEFDIAEVTPLSVVPQSFIPALFGHATGDSFIKIHHSERLHEAYAGDKNFIKVEGDHNSARPAFFKNSVAIFFTHTLQLDQMLIGGNSTYVQHMKEFAAAAASASRGAGEATGTSGPAPALPSPGGPRPGQGAPWGSMRLSSGGPRPFASVSTRSEADSIASGMLQREALMDALSASPSQDVETLLEQERLQEEEEDLARAIQASLLDAQFSSENHSQQPAHASHESKPASVAAGVAVQSSRLPTGQTSQNGGQSVQGPGHAAAAAAVVVQQDGMSAAAVAYVGPTSDEDEEEMFRRALALSLQEETASARASQPAQPQPTQPPDYVDLLVRELGGMAKVGAEGSAK